MKSVQNGFIGFHVYIYGNTQLLNKLFNILKNNILTMEICNVYQLNIKLKDMPKDSYICSFDHLI